MKVCEVIVQQPNVQPSAIKQQSRVSKVVTKIADSEAQQQPTEMDKVMAMRQYAAMKTQTDNNYATGLSNQLATAKRFVKK